MKKISHTLLLLLSLTGFAQEGGKEFYSKDFNWTITIPQGFTKANEEADRKDREDGIALIEDSYDVELGTEIIDNSQVIFVVEKDEFTYIEAISQPYNAKEDGDYAQLQEDIVNLMVGALEAQVGEEADIRVNPSEETISGRRFYHNEIIVSIDGNDILWIQMYSSLFGKDKDFTANIFYMDEADGAVMLKAFRDSKFK